jgi:Flp pilus assembly pilin Flp
VIAPPRDDRGSVTTEYVVVLALVAVGAAAGIVSLGAPLVALFGLQRAWLTLPVP